MHFSVLIECRLTDNSITAVRLCLVYSVTDIPSTAQTPAAESVC